MINKGLQQVKTTKAKKSFICLTRLNTIFFNKKKLCMHLKYITHTKK